MSTVPHDPRSGPPADRDALERDIAVTRERLAETADALAAKADVKAQAQAKVEEVKGQARHAAEDARATAAAKLSVVTSKVHDTSAQAPGSPKQQSGVLLGAVVVATAVAVWLIVRRER
ncbi:DUF3618 domain-containing protein [Kineococcus terrestris]|uniref:DUF3618 domain-containing protein n=1 Tax=Kineococcus terrestris TaxID=2044856 RepID=UPI0034DB381A